MKTLLVQEYAGVAELKPKEHEGFNLLLSLVTI